MIVDCVRSLYYSLSIEWVGWWLLGCSLSCTQPLTNFRYDSVDMNVWYGELRSSPVIPKKSRPKKLVSYILHSSRLQLRPLSNFRIPCSMCALVLILSRVAACALSYVVIVVGIGKRYNSNNKRIAEEDG